MQITREFVEDIFRRLQKEIAGLKQGPWAVTRPVIVHISMPSANTEYPAGGYEIPDGTVSIRAHTTDGTAFRLAFEKDKVATPDPPYYTIATNGEFRERGLSTRTLRLYVACGSTSKTAEVICWKKEEV